MENFKLNVTAKLVDLKIIKGKHCQNCAPTSRVPPKSNLCKSVHMVPTNLKKQCLQTPGIVYTA